MATARSTQQQPSSAQPRRRRLPRWPFVLAGGALALLAAAALGLYLALFMLTGSDYILRGVSVGGIPVGNMTRTEALNVLQQQWRSTQLRLTAGSDGWPATAADLGLQLDALALVNEAYALGRDSDWWRDPRALLGLTVDLPPRYRVDWATADAYLATLAPQVLIPPQDAQLYVADGEALTLASVPGRALDVAATLAAWQTQWEAGLQARQLALVTAPVQPAFADASALAGQANALMARPLTVRAYDPVSDALLDLSPPDATRRGWYQFNVVDQQLQTALDTAAIAGWLEQQGAALGDRYLAADDAPALVAALNTGTPAVDLRLRHRPRTHVVQTGETLSSIGYRYGIPYPWIQAANNGLEAIFPGQQVVIPPADALLPLPVVRDKRIRVSLSQQRMWAYENGALKWEWPVSTGIADSPTSPGVFQVQSHETNAYASVWDLYMPYFMGIYTPAPNIGFMNGFHGFPTRDGVNLLWTNSLGRPATYGCILVSNSNVEQLYAWAETGTVVEVVP